MWSYFLLSRRVPVSSTHSNTHHDTDETHISVDEHVEPDGVGFDQGAVVCPVLHLIILGKPVKCDKIKGVLVTARLSKAELRVIKAVTSGTGKDPVQSSTTKLHTMSGIDDWEPPMDTYLVVCSRISSFST